MAHSLAAVIDTVRLAFAEVLPPIPPLTPCNCCECASIATFLTDRDRKTLSQADVAIFGSMNIHLISIPTICYFFPNIIERALAPDQLDFLDSILYFLSYTFEYDPSRFELFTAAQRQSIVNVLEYLEEAYVTDRLPLHDPYQLDLALRMWRGS